MSRGSGRKLEQAYTVTDRCNDTGHRLLRYNWSSRNVTVPFQSYDFNSAAAAAPATRKTGHEAYAAADFQRSGDHRTIKDLRPIGRDTRTVENCHAQTDGREKAKQIQW